VNLYALAVGMSAFGSRPDQGSRGVQPPLLTICDIKPLTALDEGLLYLIVDELRVEETC
jgi:hypothetical protein